jgi:hypothetical protein
MAVMALTVVAWPVAGHAQVDRPGVGFDPNAGRSADFDIRAEPTVRERRQPQLDPVPLRVGSFDLLASGGVQAAYDSNIFATRDDAKGDVIGTAAGAAQISSNWSRHAVGGFARIEANTFANHPDQNFTLFGLGAAGRYDLSRGANLQLGGQLVRNVLSRFSSRSTQTRRDQVLFNDLQLFVGGVWGMSTVQFSGSLLYSAQRFDDVASSPAAFTEQFDDSNARQAQVRAQYALTGQLSFFVQGTIGNRNYRTSPTGQPLRDSASSEIVAGARSELHALVRGEASIGYSRQNFDADLYSDIGGFAYHLQLSFLPDPILTLTARADRTIVDSALIGAGAFKSNAFSLQADYELRRNLIVTGVGEYAHDRLQGASLIYDRFTGRIETRYTFSRALVAQVSAEYQRRDASGALPSRTFTGRRLRIGCAYRF